MAQEENIKIENNSAITGMDMDKTPSQVEKGKTTYSLNANVENFDANSVAYQNESGNELCMNFPEGYVVVGHHFINEKNIHIFFLANPSIGGSIIGKVFDNSCIFETLVNDDCLGFDVHHPIHKIVHKISNCSTDIFWPDRWGRRHLDIDNIPYKLISGSSLCDPVHSKEIDCNQLKIQPKFSIPLLSINNVINGGNLIAGTYQFGIQYSDASGNPFTSYYSITNPTPIADEKVTSVNFNYNVGKSIILDVSNLDVTGEFQYVNIAVIKTINDISSAELIGTYFIEGNSIQVTYTGQNVSNIRLSMNDVFEKFPYYDVAEDVTTAQDILIWTGLTANDRINYQSIASKIPLQWETWRIPAGENYADEINATNLRGYVRDEIYAFEIAFLLSNGRQTDGFHLPGKIKGYNENRPDVPDTNADFIGSPDYYIGNTGYAPYWKIYNTASVTGYSDGYSSSPTYKGAYQYGEFAYCESTEEYPCNSDLWGELSGQKIRHHKFPDVNISPIMENRTINGGILTMGDDAIFPIGVKIDANYVYSLVQSSSLTQQQKDEIVGFKILRGNRGTNKSIIAKGIVRNVNSYTRDGKDFYFPNYPYNDVNVDPFLNSSNNAFSDVCKCYDVTIQRLATFNDGTPDSANIEYIDCNTGLNKIETKTEIGTYKICSIGRPIVVSPLGNVVQEAKGVAGMSNYDVWTAQTNCFFCNGYRISYYSRWDGYREDWIQGGPGIWTKHYYVEEGTVLTFIEGPGTPNFTFIQHVEGDTLHCSDRDNPLHAIKDSVDDVLLSQQVFNSPETSFGQPFLGDVLKMESVIYGAGKAHFTQVKDEAKYKLLTKEAQEDALSSSAAMGDLTSDFNVGAFFSAYESYLKIYTEEIMRRNYAHSFNSIASYDYSNGVPDNLGIKQRNISSSKYLIPRVISVDDAIINNYNRETSVYIKTDEKFPLPNTLSNGVTDNSRFIISEKGNCNNPSNDEDISVVSYYASMKNIISNQWGQLYTYDVIDTGYQYMFNTSSNKTVFGGDTFISRFAFKTKLPFFIDDRVGAPDDSDVFYDELGNVAFPKYWHSSRSITSDYTVPTSNSDSPGTLYNYVSYKAHNFDCANSQSEKDTPNRLFYDGYFYLYAYGIPYFYCETSYNLDLRQSFNNREGEFWPHVTSHIPDDWVQQSFVPIEQDNTYYYNVTFSKQNKENSFTHLPSDWENKACFTSYPFRSIYSDVQNTDSDNRIDSWLIYRAVSYYDFPQNFGKLISLDGIQNRAILARFENKTLLYNNLLTIDTSNPQAAYLGNNKLFDNQYPPIDFAETDLGYVGSQHKFLLKIPQGQITIDAKRGQVFLINGTQATDLSAFGSGMNRWFTDHLAFEILRFFPYINIDNHYNGIGLHGVYDSKFDRVIITKIDYVPLSTDVKYDYDEEEFYIENTLPETDYTYRTIIQLGDEDFFCNRSWTISYNMNTKSWVSFHSYIPNWYIAENNFFYSGINDCCADFEVIAGTLIPMTTTTTTSTTTSSTTSTSTTTSTTSTTTSTSTTSTTTTTTTTACVRPIELTAYTLYTGYTSINPAFLFDSTQSKEECCSAANVVFFGDPTNIYPTFFYGESFSPLAIGNIMYSDLNVTNCNCVPDGWYFTDETAVTGNVIYIKDCVIDRIEACITTTTTTTTTSTTTSTTTTTTTTGIPVIDCNIIYNYASGGVSYPKTVNVTLGSSTGQCVLTVDAYSIPDRFIVIWDGNVKIDTGYRGSPNYDLGGSSRPGFNYFLTGKIDPITSNPYPDNITYPDDGYPRVTWPGNNSYSFTKSNSSSIATVSVYAPMMSTQWNFTLGCPTTTTTTTSTTTTTTTTAIPIYTYYISTIEDDDASSACLQEDPTYYTVYSSYDILDLEGEELFTNIALTILFTAADKYYKFYKDGDGVSYALHLVSNHVDSLTSCL